MIQKWMFVKYVGCGNDFILFDNRLKKFPVNSEIISGLCNRQQGIGADGVILLENSSVADFRMRIFNSNGSEAEMCGNGMRCLMRFLGHLGHNDPGYKISVMHHILTVDLDGDYVKVSMNEPSQIKWNISLPLEDHVFKAHYIDTGVPHTVLFTENIIQLEVKKLGSCIRFNPLFGLKGTNVNFAESLNRNTFFVRTYERGVENETLSCGTGAVAVALAATHQFGSTSPIYIKTGQKEELKIMFSRNDEKFSDITLTGSAHLTFQGLVNL